jgi:hypothetical protein
MNDVQGVARHFEAPAPGGSACRPVTVNAREDGRAQGRAHSGFLRAGYLRGARW